jgi:hypothetical protein
MWVTAIEQVSFEGAPVTPFGAIKVPGDKRTARIAFLMFKMGGFTILVDAPSSHPAAAFSASIIHETAETQGFIDFDWSPLACS